MVLRPLGQTISNNQLQLGFYPTHKQEQLLKPKRTLKIVSVITNNAIRKN